MGRFQYREAVLPDGTLVCVVPSGVMELHPHGGEGWHVAEGDCAKILGKRQKMLDREDGRHETEKSAGTDRPRSANPADCGRA